MDKRDLIENLNHALPTISPLIIGLTARVRNMHPMSWGSQILVAAAGAVLSALLVALLGYLLVIPRLVEKLDNLKLSFDAFVLDVNARTSSRLRNEREVAVTLEKHTAELTQIQKDHERRRP